MIMEKVIAAINNLNPAFVVITGDMVMMVRIKSKLMNLSGFVN